MYPNPISFMTANFVARQSGYHMTDWGLAEKATIAYFQPVETYAERFGAMLDEVCRMGFDHIDLWLPHLHPQWATERHIELANAALSRRGLKVSSLAGWFGANTEEFERCCRVAQAVGARVLGGLTALVEANATADDRWTMVKLLEKYDTLMAIENHPEKVPAEVLAKIGDGGGGRIGTTIDTGIWLIYGYDAVQAIQELWPHVFHVHLKDIVAVGSHESCRYGRGVVPLKQSVETLLEKGYQGGFSVEHEPSDYDPTEDVTASFVMLKEWMK